ncbi:MAG: FAD-binding dehydrogenase [Flavobacteriales bacterium]|nr:FAD-binding dehydrogenase [Flavobacteriales bacterium]MCB9190397.1 FAD-binding dehydrogenase [Flavobacteriales bacterium]MCB9204646.1 FAD-binding dehydrogenase [Flavobacteriales bacterium]
MKEYKADAVIVGGGIAGIAAAIELLNEGQKVLVVDRDIEAELGGLAKWSFGGMFFVDSPLQRRAGIKDSVDLALRDWLSVADFGESDVLPKQWAEQYVNMCTDQVYRWLTKEHGTKFFPVVHWVERGLFKPGNSYPRFHMVWGTGKGLTDDLIRSLKNHSKASTHLQMVYRHKGEELIVEGGKVVGIKGMDEEANVPFVANGDNVLVATGGLGGNIQRVKDTWYKPWGKPPEVILNGSHPYALGDMHDAVEHIEGNVTNLDWAWHYAAGVRHPRPKWKDHGLSLVPPKSALWLDHTGKRFGPNPLITAYDTRWTVEEICKQDKKYSWQVLNMKIMIKEFAISGAESNEAIRDKNLFKFLKDILLGNKKLVNDMIDNCPDFVTATSLEELVKKMNELQGTDDVKLQHVKDSVLQYDEQIDRGPNFHNDEQLRRIAHARQYRGDKVRTCKFQKIVDPKAMPLVAIRESILSRKTLGGIQTDLSGRVMSKPVNGNSEPIPGLYAIGEAAGFGGGGSHGKGALEGTFLGGCVLTARIAAKSIVNKKL